MAVPFCCIGRFNFTVNFIIPYRDHRPYIILDYTVRVAKRKNLSKSYYLLLFLNSAEAVAVSGFRSDWHKSKLTLISVGNNETQCTLFRTLSGLKTKKQSEVKNKIKL